MKKTRVVRWSVPGEDGHLRYTDCKLETVTVRRQGRRAGYAEDADVWFKAQHSMSVRDAVSDTSNDLFPLAWACVEWTFVAASLVSVTEGTRSPETGEESGQEVSMDGTWTDLGWYLDNVPADFASALARAVSEVNPNIFGIDYGEEAKNAGGVSVR